MLVELGVQPRGGILTEPPDGNTTIPLLMLFQAGAGTA
jgi:hypothetical protein